MQKKYQVFVSSTFRDLADERQDAIRTILDLGHIPAGMELFPASDTEQLTYIKKVIDECDYYVLIMGGRYGSLDEDGISYTEREYDYAVTTGKTVLAFPHGDLSIIPVGKTDIAERMRQNLDDFRAKVMTGRLVREWTTREQLESLVVKSLVRAFADYPAVGWVRGDTVANESILSQLNDVRGENDTLKSEIAKMRSDQQPQIDSLANFDETFTIHYKYTRHFNGRSSYEKGTVDLTWRQILIAVGNDFMHPRQRIVVSTAISTYVKEVLGKSHSISVYGTDVDTIVNQLIALKMLNSYQATAVKGGVSEFLNLTPEGKKTLIEFSAVRATPSKSADA